MLQDKFGQIILSEDDICGLVLKNPEKKLDEIITYKPISFNPDLELNYVPDFKVVEDLDQTVEEFDLNMQSNWHMPDEYYKLDIAVWLLDKCTTDTERQRVGQELLLYLDRGLFPLLQYLKYLVDTMRKYNIVWGVGRGSSVSSYVLYLIGVHKIDSLYYDLDIEEFLR